MSRRTLVAVTAAATLALISPSVSEATGTAASVATGTAASVGNTVQAAAPCAEAMHEAVVQDNVAYNARDEAAYREVIHPDISWRPRRAAA